MQSERNISYFMVANSSHMAAWGNQVEVSDLFARITNSSAEWRMRSLTSQGNGAIRSSGGWIYVFAFGLILFMGAAVFVMKNNWVHIKNRLTGGYRPNTNIMPEHDVELQMVIGNDSDED